MDIKNILKTVGTAVLASNPIGAAAIPLINAFLPGDETLPVDATGQHVQERINQLPPAIQNELLSKQIDLQIQQVKSDADKYASMCQADGQETRAKIVDKAMNALIAISLIFIVATAFVYSDKGADAAFSYEMGACFLTVTGTFAFVIRAYFGDLRTETQSRHSAHANQPPQSKGLAGLIQAIKQ